MSMFDVDPRQGTAIAGPVAPQQEGPGAAVRVGVLLDGLRRRWWLLALGLVRAAGAAAVGKMRSKASYRTEAIVAVAPIVPHVAFTGEEWRAESIVSFYDDYVRTLCQRMRG